MTEDPKFKEFLHREAEHYNRPPAEVPRDEMFAAIQAARAARRTPAPRRVGSTPPRPRYTMWIGMAATLLIGVGIGRFAMQRDPVAVADLRSADSSAAGTTPVSAIAAAAPAIPVSSSDDAPPARSVRTVAPRAPERAQDSGVAPRSPSPYAVASQAHLARAEALIAVVATQSGDAVVDSVTAAWARDVLTNTRLLLDSPAGDDPVRRRLFEDVETLLVQLIQRSGSPADERALFDRTLQKTQILTRLRTGAAGT